MKPLRLLPKNVPIPTWVQPFIYMVEQQQHYSVQSIWVSQDGEECTFALARKKQPRVVYSLRRSDYPNLKSNLATLFLFDGPPLDAG